MQHGHLRDKFQWLRALMGAKKAAVAVAHKILVAAFHMLQRAVAFTDLGADYLDRIDKYRTAKRLVAVSTPSATTSCSGPRPQPEPHRHATSAPRARPTVCLFGPATPKVYPARPSASALQDRYRNS